MVCIQKPNSSPFSIMERALRGGITLDQVEKMMELQGRI